MTGKRAGKPLSYKAVEMMKPGDKNKANTGENWGLRVTCGASGNHPGNPQQFIRQSNNSPIKSAFFPDAINPHA